MLIARPALLPLASLGAAALASQSLPAAAQGHQLRGSLSQAGLDFVAEQVPKLVPKDLYPDDMSKDWSCMTATQRDTHVALAVHDFAISIPARDRLQLYVNLSARGDGELHVDDVYACFGSMTCQDEIIVNDARATFDFDVQLVGGRPSVSLRSVSLDLSHDDIDINFSGCPADDVASWMVDFGKKYVIDSLVSKAEQLAVEKLGPKVEEMLAGVGAFEGSLGSTDFSAELADLYVESDRIDLGAQVDLSSKFPADECVVEWDPGEPTDVAGQAPDLAAVPSHLGLAINFGMLNDALYHVWRRGLTCLTGEHLYALGIHLDTDHIMELMPGFPPGTELDIDVSMTAPLRVRGATGDGAAVTLALEGLRVTLIGALPDGTEKRVDIGLDAEATAVVGVDPSSNALVATPTAVEIKRLEMDQLYVTQTGFDVTRVMSMMHDHVVPKMLDKMGSLPLTGPVFTAGDYAVILRRLGNNEAFLSVNADLFAIPDNDVGAPETSILDYPSGVVSPAASVIQVSGVDGMIPTELLQYAVTVNGEARPTGFINRFQVGVPGESGTYDVQVAALDLSGNIDATPASVQITVDGVSPQVVLQGERVRRMHGGTTEIAWTMRDDLTDAALLGARIELYQVTDPSDLLSVEHLRTIELAPGATLASVEIADGELYRAEVRVTDAVGNETVATVLLDASKEGCRLAGGGAGGPLGLLALLGLAAAVRRGRRARRD